MSKTSETPVEKIGVYSMVRMTKVVALPRFELPVRSCLTRAAHREIEGMIFCEENYVQAINILQERFGRKQAIVAELYTRLDNVRHPGNNTKDEELSLMK